LNPPSATEVSWSSDDFVEYVDLDEEDTVIEPTRKLVIPADMQYTPQNVAKQGKTFKSIYAAGGKDTVMDIYVRDPDTSTFWFVGKVARCTGTVTPQGAVSRQWNLIEQHAARLRPNDLGVKFGKLQIWAAPGDSEMDVAYNRPFVKFVKMSPPEGVVDVPIAEVGFSGEVYVGGEEGFRTARTEEGLPAKPEIKSAPTVDTVGADESGVQNTGRRPSDTEMDDLMKMLNDGVTREQQRGSL